MKQISAPSSAPETSMARDLTATTASKIIRTAPATIWRSGGNPGNGI
ncbi:MAG TPA: hypothetical protein VN739_07435 [Nitrososphaerales archaeon]|nr:hypothetical protein [Nitrososphaerales archaeon]